MKNNIDDVGFVRIIVADIELNTRLIPSVFMQPELQMAALWLNVGL